MVIRGLNIDMTRRQSVAGRGYGCRAVQGAQTQVLCTTGRLPLV